MRRLLLCILVLVLAATVVSGGFLLHARDLHLPACNEPWDAAIYPWNFFWLSEWLPDSLGGADGNLLFTHRLGWPAGEGLGLYTPTWVYDVVALPFQWIGDAPDSRHVAVAALLWLSSVATALLAYALARELGLTRPGALLVALLALVASGRLMNAARLNLFCTEFLLLYLLAGLQWWKRGGFLRGAWLGFVASLLLLQSQPLFFQAAVVTALLLVAALFKKGARSQLKARLPSFGPAVVLFLLLTGPFLWAMVSQLPHSRASEQSAAFTASIGSLDPADLVLPSSADRFARAYAALLPTRLPSGYEFGGPLGTVSHFLGLGWIALLLLAVTTRGDGGSRLGRRAFWLALALLLVAMGPLLHWRMQALPVPLPYALLSYVPLLALEKSPTRLLLLAQLFLAIAAARGFERLAFARGEGGAAKWRPLTGAIAALLALVTLAEQGETVPLRSIEPRMTIPAEVRALAHEPGTFAVLDLPFDHPGNASHCVNGLAMAMAAAHERPIFFGLYPRAVRASEPDLQKRTLFRLIARCEAKPTPGAAPPNYTSDELAAARRDLADLEVGAVQLHDVTFDPERSPGERARLRDLLRQLAPRSESALEPGKGYSLTLFRF